MSDELTALVSALEDAGCVVRGRAVTCAFHGDRDASGSIYDGGDGRPRYKCHACAAGGDAADIIALFTGRSLAEVLRDQKNSQVSPRSTQAPIAGPTSSKDANSTTVLKTTRTYTCLDGLLATLPTAEAVYRYTNPLTLAVDLVVIRLPGKRFLQASPCPAGGWWMKRPQGPLPLYNRSRIATAQEIVVCEGEKDVHALNDLGIVATTAPMGADTATVSTEKDGKPGQVDWSPVAGKTVILWGDADEPGRRHLVRIERIISKLHPRPTVLRVDHAALAGAKDAADLIDRAGSPEAAEDAVLRVMATAQVLSPSSPLLARLEATISGAMATIPLPWSALDRLARPLMPGAVVLVAGDPGSSKSFLLLQAVLAWLDSGVPIALLELEEDAGFWSQRALALVAGISSVTDLQWVHDHPAESLELYQHHRPELDRLGLALTCAPVGGMTLSAVAAWVEAQVAAGARIIALDPVTAADEGAKPWDEARRFMNRIQTAIAGKASVILTTHPKKRFGPKQAPSLDDLAGGTAYGRFCSAALWLELHAEPTASTVVDAAGHQKEAVCNRSVRIIKTRNGRGAGLRVGFQFSGESLRLEELGLIVTPPSQVQASPSPRRSRAARILAGPQRSEDHFNGINHVQ